MRYSIIIAGGKGERLWPLSNYHQPKHFLDVVGESPLIRQTYERVVQIVSSKNIYLVITAPYLEIARTLLPEIPEDNILVEPMGRDTAAAIGLAVAAIYAQKPKASIFISPADHFIQNTQHFVQDVDLALDYVEHNDVIVTFGIKPNSPSIQYGYIKKAQSLSQFDFYTAERFVEKPNHETARNYIESGTYLWNSGMLVLRAEVFLSTAKQHCHWLSEFVEKILQVANKKNDLEQFLKEVYPLLQKISLDYALLEKANNIVVKTASFDWDDVGSWNSVKPYLPKDENHNATKGNVFLEHAKDNMVYNATNNKLVALFGVHDITVIETDAVTFVCKNTHLDQLKPFLSKLADDSKFKELL